MGILQFGEFGLFLIVDIPDLHHGPVTAHPGDHFFPALSVDAQFPLALDTLSILDSILDIFFERVVEIIDHFAPYQPALRYFIELFFDPGGKAVIHDIVKVLLEEVGHHETQVGREKFGFLRTGIFLFLQLFNPVIFQHHDTEIPFDAFFIPFFHVSSFQDGGDSGSIGGRPADT